MRLSTCHTFVIYWVPDRAYACCEVYLPRFLQWAPIVQIWNSLHIHFRPSHIFVTNAPIALPTFHFITTACPKVPLIQTAGTCAGSPACADCSVHYDVSLAVHPVFVGSGHYALAAKTRCLNVSTLQRPGHARLAAAPIRRPPGPLPHCTSKLAQKAVWWVGSFSVQHYVWPPASNIHFYRRNCFNASCPVFTENMTFGLNGISVFNIVPVTLATPVVPEPASALRTADAACELGFDWPSRIWYLFSSKT